MTRKLETLPPVPDVHAFRHAMKPGGRESLAHMLMFPEHGIAGFIYPAVLADGSAKAKMTLFGAGLSAPIHEQFDEVVSDTMNFDDWRSGPLRMAVTQPHQRVELEWNGERIRFKGAFEALHPPYLFSSNPAGNPPYYGDDRTEQHGRLTAELEVEGRTLALSGYLIRDHSWGPRIWGLNQHYKWFHAATEHCSVHFFEMLSFGRRQLRGFVYKEGVIQHLTEADYDFTYNDQMMQQTFRAEVGDAAGRKVVITCEAFANIQLEYDPMVYLNEAPVTVEIDGQPGAGWCEFCFNRNYFDFARQHVTQYG